MNHKEALLLKDILRRMTSLKNSAVNLSEFLLSVQKTSGLSPQLQLRVVATSDCLLLTTAVLYALQYDMDRSNWTEDFTHLLNLRRLCRTAYENLESLAPVLEERVFTDED